MKDEALKLALEALEFIPESGSMIGAHAEEKRVKAITAIKQERQWVGLTNHDIEEMVEMYMGINPNLRLLMRDIEAKLKEKNT